MSIERLCRRQRNSADRLFMDFKYTDPGSDEQIQALNTFHSLISLWAHYLSMTSPEQTNLISKQPSRLS